MTRHLRNTVVALLAGAAVLCAAQPFPPVAIATGSRGAGFYKPEVRAFIGYHLNRKDTRAPQRTDPVVARPVTLGPGSARPFYRAIAENPCDAIPGEADRDGWSDRANPPGFLARHRLQRAE